MIKTVLVTGGTGFLGSNLCSRLINDGNKVLCVDNNYTGRMENIAPLANDPNFSFIPHDICRPLEIKCHIDSIYNLACPASPSAYQGINSITTTKTCILGAINMLELAKEHNATILQASTSEVYGEPLVHPQPENYFGNVNPIGIRSCYDEGKRCAESLFFDYHRYQNINIKVVRIFNTYGPNMSPTDGRVISNFICQALSEKNITVYGNGNQTRSFCYVDDLTDALVRMMNSPKELTGPINLGNPEEISINELAERIAEKTGKNIKIIHTSLPSDDPSRRKPDISAAKEKLEWEPKTSLDEGLDKTLRYFKIQLGVLND